MMLRKRRACSLLRRDLQRVRFCSGQSSPVWRPCATRQSSCLEKKRPARSARTRRSLGVRANVRGVDYGTTGDLRFGCRWFDSSDDTVRHKSSPSRRDVSRQVVSLLVSSNSNCRYRTPKCPALRRRVSSSTRSLAPRSRCQTPTDVLVSLVRSPELPGISPEKF
jgi:hypothetical protein